MNRKTLPHFSFQQLTIDQDKVNQEENQGEKQESNESPSITNTPTPCTTPQITGVPDGVLNRDVQNKVLKKNRTILEDQITKQTMSRIQGRDSISPCIDDQTGITKIAEEVKGEQGVVIQQPSKAPSQSKIKSYVDLFESKVETRQQSIEPVKRPKKAKKSHRQEPKYVRYLHKEEIDHNEQESQNCCSRGFKQFNTLIRLLCVKSKQVKISKKSSFTMVYCILSFNMLLTGLHTKFVYYNHQENSISQINFASMGAVLLQSIILFCTIKIPFECLLNRRKRAPHLDEPTIEYMSEYTPPFAASQVKPNKGACRRCTAKRVAFLLILLLSVSSLVGIIAIQVLFFVKLSLIWLCLFIIGFLFYFTIFEVIMTLFILCFEKDCQRLCGGCLEGNPDNSALPYRAQL